MAISDRLQAIMTYKALHALCSTNKDGKMKVVYYVSCLVYGRAPLWGVWNVSGKFLHFAPGREAVADMHPNLAWRRVMARWSLADDADSVAHERRQRLSIELDKPLPDETPETPKTRQDIVEAQARRRPTVMLQ
jgi:hypothetical protein